MKIQALTKEDTSLLKGLGIFLIIMHNFCHWLPNMTKENEYTYNIHNSLSWLANLTDGGPHVILNSFSFWGHYGVSIFLFLSGYGLVKKYESNYSSPLIFIPFMKHNYLKLWTLIVGGIISHFALRLFLSLDFSEIKDIPLLITFCTNLIPDSNIIHGPWWFFSLIIQFYIIYSIFFYKKNQFIPYIFIALSLLLMVFVSLYHGTSSDTLHYIRFNSFGWVLPFSLGVITSRSNYNIPIKFSLISFIIWVLCEFNAYSWLIGPFFFIFSILPLTKIKNLWIRKSFIYLGTISASLFLLHPFTRLVSLKILEICDFTGAVYFSILIYLITSIVIAHVYHHFQAKMLKFIK